VSIVSTNIHGLGYCPATTISKTDRFVGCEIGKKSPISDALDLADKYIIDTVATINSNMSTAYKKQFEVETRFDCGNEYCDNGEIPTDHGSVSCGTCAEMKRRNLSAFGRIMEIPNPDKLSENAIKLYGNPFGEAASDVPLLLFQKEHLKQSETRIKDVCLGQ
jgi:hypothetical protein